MKNIKNLVLIVCLFLVGNESHSQDYQRLTSGNKIKGGHTYILPKAAIVVEVPIIMTTLVPGEAIEDYNPTQLKILEKKYGVDPKKYALAKSGKNLTKYIISEDSIKISLNAVADHDKIFYVDPSYKWNKNQGVTFTYSADGILSEGESSIENKTFDLVVKGISGLTSIVGAFFKGTTSADYSSDPTNIEPLDVALAKFKTLDNQINFDIYKDLKARYEKNYTEIFSTLFYKEKRKITIIKFIYIPSSQTAVDTEIPLFKLNENSGYLQYNKKLTTEITSKDTDFIDADAKFFSIKFDKIKEQQSNFFDPRDDKKTGFAYNIPLSANLQLANKDKKKLYYGMAKIPQLGIVGYITTVKRNGKLTFSLDPITGELKKLSVEGKAITSEQIGSVSSGVNEIITSIKGDSELTKLENEVKKLENEKKKRELLRDLEIE